MLIAIDHGNYAVKTPRFSFVSGLAEHTVKPPMSGEILEYGANSGRSPPAVCPICGIRPRTIATLF